MNFNMFSQPKNSLIVNTTYPEVDKVFFLRFHQPVYQDIHLYL